MRAQGLSLKQAVDSLGHVAEGVYSARTVVQRAAVAGVDMPISEAVVALLDGRLRPVEAVAALMGRGPKLETVWAGVDSGRRVGQAHVDRCKSLGLGDLDQGLLGQLQ